MCTSFVSLTFFSSLFETFSFADRAMALENMFTKGRDQASAKVNSWLRISQLNTQVSLLYNGI